MKIESRNLLVLIVLYLSGLFMSQGISQPKLVFSEPSSYQVGDQIDQAVTLIDSKMRKVSLREVLDPNAEVSVLAIFGGAAATVPSSEFRGKLWCQDTLDDFGVQRAVVNQFRGQPVQFIGVAIPPVYSTSKYGFEDNVFHGKREESPSYEKALKVFIEKTEELKSSTLIPFEALYYDPKARLLQDMEDIEVGPEYGEVQEWQGMLKWRQDPRKYGAPTIWILDNQGRVLTEPFWGNDYGSSPPQINYGFVELKESIEGLLTP